MRTLFVSYVYRQSAHNLVMNTYFIENTISNVSIFVGNIISTITRTSPEINKKKCPVGRNVCYFIECTEGNES